MKRSLAILLFITALSIGAFSQTATGHVFWSGTVDDRAQLIVNAEGVFVKTISGKENPQGNYSFSTYFPSSETKVNVLTKDGRSPATVVQQPTAANGYTAIIEIYDSKGGDDDYLLDIYW
jgi:hypothetical protein